MNAVGSPKVHSGSEIVWVLDGPLRETVVEMMTVAHRTSQSPDSKTQGVCYRNEESAVTLFSGFANAYIQSLFPTYEDQVASDVSTLAHERVIEMPANKGIIPSQQMFLIVGKWYHLLCPLRCGDHRKSNKAWWVRLVEYEAGRG